MNEHISPRLSMLTKYIVIVVLIVISFGGFGCFDPISPENLDLEPEVDTIYRPIRDNEIQQTRAFVDSLPKLYPVDESHFDSNFAAFAIELRNAIANRDTSFIYRMVDTGILNSYGGNGGIEEFKQWWKLDSSDSKFWEVFGSAFALGGTFSADTTQFIFPYTFTRFTVNCGGYFCGALATDQGVVYRAAHVDSMFDTVAYSVFEELQWSVTGERWNDVFTPVKIGEYRYGFLKRSEFRRPTDYRGGLIRKSDGWVLTFFVAGD